MKIPHSSQIHKLLSLTVASGAWTNPATWTVGRVPTASENIRVNTGHVVTLSQNTTVRSVKLYGKITYSPGVRLRITG